MLGFLHALLKLEDVSTERSTNLVGWLSNLTHKSPGKPGTIGSHQQSGLDYYAPKASCAVLCFGPSQKRNQICGASTSPKLDNWRYDLGLDPAIAS